MPKLKPCLAIPSAVPTTLQLSAIFGNFGIRGNGFDWCLVIRSRSRPGSKHLDGTWRKMSLSFEDFRTHAPPVSDSAITRDSGDFLGASPSPDEAAPVKKFAKNCREK